MIAGEVQVRTPAGRSSWRAPGDLVCFPAGPAAPTRSGTRRDEPARVVMFSAGDVPAVAVYPDSDKVGVWTGDEHDHWMFRGAEAQLEYYDGELPPRISALRGTWPAGREPRQLARAAPHPRGTLGDWSTPASIEDSWCGRVRGDRLRLLATEPAASLGTTIAPGQFFTDAARRWRSSRRRIIRIARPGSPGDQRARRLRAQQLRANNAGTASASRPRTSPPRRPPGRTLETVTATRPGLERRHGRRRQPSRRDRLARARPTCRARRCCWISRARSPARR